MTITLTREEAQQVLDVMEGSIDAQELVACELRTMLHKEFARHV
jgi:hypothetical protein